MKYNVNDDSVPSTATPWLHTKMNTLFQSEEIEDALTIAAHRLRESVERWIGRGSGCDFHRVINLRKNISKYRPLRSGSYLPLPKEVWAKKGIVNVQNQDYH